MTLSFEMPPRFYDNVDQFLSPADLNILRRDAMVVDGLSFRLNVAMDQGAIFHGATPGNNPDNPPFRIRSGYFRFRTGCTTFTITGRAFGTGGTLIRVYLDGALADSFTAPNGDFSRAISITGKGYTEGQVVRWDVNCEGSGSTKSLAYTVREAYLSPVTKSGWVAPTTFTQSTINETNLNRLGDAMEWVYQRCAMVPYPSQRVPLYMLGSFREVPDTRGVYFGSVCKTQSNDILRIYGQVINASSPGLVVKVYLHNSGTPTYTSSTMGIGTHNISIPISLSAYSVGTAVDFAVYSETTDSGIRDNWKFSRWSFSAVRAEADASGYAYTTPPAKLAPTQTLSASALVTWLNGLVNMTNAAKARIDANPHIYSRVRALPRWPGYDDKPDSLENKRWPVMFTRIGKRLIVRGVGVDLKFGPITVPQSDRGPDYENHTFLKTHNVVGTDKLDTKEVYLDTVAGLYTGTRYYLTGDVHYAEEVLE